MLSVANLPKPKGINLRIINFLKTGQDFTSNEAVTLFGVKNVSAHVSKLRRMGYSIYCNKHKDAYGAYFLYRLGSPRRSVVAAGVGAIRKANARKRNARKK